MKSVILAQEALRRCGFVYLDSLYEPDVVANWNKSFKDFMKKRERRWRLAISVPRSWKERSDVAVRVPVQRHIHLRKPILTFYSSTFVQGYVQNGTSDCDYIEAR